MKAVNSAYFTGENASKAIRQRAADDAQLVGANLQNRRQQVGVLRGISGALIDADNWIRNGNDST